MSIVDSIALFMIMLTLAIIPSTSVVLVVTRSATLDIANGVAVALGIVLGDLVFVVLAIFGLSIVAETMSGLFVAIKVIGGIYLLWVGYTLIVAKDITNITLDQSRAKSGLVTSFFAGFFLTLADIKAIFFYVSLFPTFVDLTALKLLDLLVLILVTIMAVGGIKIAYAFSAIKVVEMSQGLQLGNSVKKLAAGFMIGAGSYLIAKTL